MQLVWKMLEKMVKDLFGNELNIGDEVVNVLIYKNEANFRKGFIENIEITKHSTFVTIRNVDTHRKTVKQTTSKDRFVCKDVLKYNWRQYLFKTEPTLFPELF